MGTFLFDARLIDDKQRGIENEANAFAPHDCTIVAGRLDVTCRCLMELDFMTKESQPSGPDLTSGVALTQFVDGKLLGHVGEEEVLLVQDGSELFAIAAHCSHYHGPLNEGLVVGGTIRCPWHHACFDLRSGDAVRAPAGRSRNGTI